MKNLLYLVYIFLIAQSLKAQVYQYAKGIGGKGSDVGQAVMVDMDGNVYTTGYFMDTVDFDPGPGIAERISTGDRDIFIIKTDKQGKLVWVHTFGGVQVDVPYSIVLDPSGYFCISGLFSSKVDFDPGPGKIELTAKGYWDIFVAKYKFSGELVWAKSMGGLDGESVISSNIDSKKNIFITGYFNGTTDFNPGPGVNNLMSNGLTDIFICKLDSSGNYIWANRIGGAMEDVATSITLDRENNIGISGLYTGAVDYDPGISTQFLNSVKGSKDIFLAKYDNDGKYLWAKSIGSDEIDQSRSIIAAPSGNLYITGPFSDTADFDPGAKVFNLTSAGNQDIFLSKFDKNGNHMWSKRFGGIGLDWAYSIAVDSSENIYFTGFFSDTVDFDPNQGIYELISKGNSDIFMAKLNSFGELDWASSFGGSGNDGGSNLKLNSSNNIYLTGYFEGAADFNPTLLVSKGRSDIFTAQFNQCINTSSTQSIIACDSYLWNGKIYNTSGSYYFIAKNSTGCDSTVELNLTINKVDTTLTINNNILTANSFGSNYQWLDCNNNFIPLSGENNRSFKPIKNGSYAVEVKDSGCVDTSSCYSVIVVITTKNKIPSIQVFPNPISNYVYVDLQEEVPIIEINVLDFLGRKVENNIFYNKSLVKIDIENITGIFFLEIKLMNGTKIIKLVKSDG